jgi:hypothetical protein
VCFFCAKFSYLERNKSQYGNAIACEALFSFPTKYVVSYHIPSTDFYLLTVKIYLSKIPTSAGYWWLTPVILAIWETEMGNIMVASHPSKQFTRP